MQESESANPVLVEVWRGDRVESRHRAAFSVVEANGNLVHYAGDVETPVYPRSSLKPVQALWLIESGAADHFKLSPRHIAVACASHGGEAGHTQLVSDWLASMGLNGGHLECGAHPPSHDGTRREMVKQGREPQNLHNNCSGKHTGFICGCVHRGYDIPGYIEPDHPAQREITTIVQECTGYDLSRAKPAVDGCGIPLYAIPLRNLAQAFAGFARANRDGSRQAARQCIVDSILENPFLIAGSKRFCTRTIENAQGSALVKTGAEGVYAGVLLDQGLGIALKIDDGATRAAEVLMAAVLHSFSNHEEFKAALASDIEVPVKNVAGRVVGKIVATLGR